MSSFYMAWTKDDLLLKKSSSGGVFSAIAEYIISCGGVVVGAYLNQSTHELSHVIIRKYEDLDKIRGSKYFQSNAYDIYLETINFVKSGKWVLFSGTACQVAALLALCKGIDKEKLITVDVLCHGVANKKIIELYLKSQEKHYKKEIAEIRFRTKAVPWYKGGETLVFKDGSEKIIPRAVDTFYMGYNNDLFLRDSCYKCRFVGIERVSDFTLGDFWGIPLEMVDDAQYTKGIGLVLVNTEKANKLWISDAIKEAIQYTEVSPQIAIPHNSALYTNRIKHKKHDYFFSKFDNKDFDILVRECLRKEYLKISLKKMIGEKQIKTIKSILKRG